MRAHTRAGWQSGYAAACKAVYAGSIPTPASTIRLIIPPASCTLPLTSCQSAYHFCSPGTNLRKICRSARMVMSRSSTRDVVPCVPDTPLIANSSTMLHAARMVKLVDTRDLKSLGPLTGHAGSTPAPGTTAVVHPEWNTYAHDRTHCTSRRASSRDQHASGTGRGRLSWMARD